MYYSSRNSNKNRWGNFSNDQLYDKYKRSQASASPASGQQQAPMTSASDPNTQLGKNIGEAWRNSLAKRSDGNYDGTDLTKWKGYDKDLSDYENMQNYLGANGNEIGASVDGAGNIGANVDANMLANTSANAATNLGSNSIGAGIANGALANAGQIGADALANTGISAGASTIGTDVGANLAANTLAEGATTVGADAIGAGVAEGGADAAAGAAGAGAGAVLGPLAAAYGVYKLGDWLKWW